MQKHQNKRRMRMIRFALCMLAFSLLSHSHTFADSGRGRHKQLYVVPAPGPVTVDGKLDDWDLSGQIEVFVQEATRATQSAGFAVMYDDEALYVSGEVRDPNPMMNRHDPRVMPHRAWDADACQFRLVIDPAAEYPVRESTFSYRGRTDEDTRDDIVHLLLWHYTDEGSAHLQMHLGMSYRSPHAEWGRHGLVPDGLFEGVFRKWDDGQGYTFEYRIPWSTLGTDTPPAGGDVVAGTMQMHWARPDGLSTGGGRSWARDIIARSGVPFQDASTWGRLLFAEQGNVPQALVLEGVPRARPLPLEFAYDLPQDGETTLQMEDADGVVHRILVAQEPRPGGRNRERWDGMDNHYAADDHGDFLAPGDYRWRGVVNTERLRAKYRFSVHNSGNPPYRTDDGKGGWGGDHGSPQDVVALEDGLLISWPASEAGFGIIRVDLAGRKQWGSNQDAIYMASDGEAIYIAAGRGFMPHEGVRKLALADARPRTYADGSDLLLPPPGGNAADNPVTGLATGGGRLYVAYGRRNLIAVYTLADAALAATWEVPQPGPLAVNAAGRLLAVSEGTVVVVADDGTLRTLIDQRLDDPQGIAVAPDGTLYVANRGALQDVSVFDADGAYLRSIGRAGGRPAMGVYDPSGIYMAGGIAIAANGRLWVAETTDFPKRVSVWDSATGGNLDEFFGAANYFAHGMIDPGRPDEIYAHNVLWTIDWDAYAVTPKSTIWRRTEPDMAPHPEATAYGGVFRMITAVNGHQFGWGGAPHQAVVVYMRDGDVFRPIVGEFSPWGGPRFDHGIPAVDRMKAAVEAEHGTIRGNTRMLFWQDGGNDGRVADGEFTVRTGDLEPLGAIIHMTPDLALWLSCGRRLPPREVTPEGRPIYNLADAEETPLTGRLVVSEGGRSWTVFDEDGAAYTSSVTHRGRPGPGLTRWHADGTLDWRFPDVLRWRDGRTLPTAGPGRLWGATQWMGAMGGFAALQNYFGATHIFRRDGQYIGAVLGGGPSGRYDPSLTDSRYDGQSEGQGGSFVMLNIEGQDRYFLIQGSHDVRVWEILGLDTLQDLPGGDYAHEASQVAQARAAYEEHLVATAGPSEIRLARGRETLDEAAAVGRRVDEGRSFEARAAYDADNLYVRFAVESPHGLVNAQTEPQILFRGGNCLDIQLAADPEADPDRTTPAPGDQRLLVTRQDGEAFAVLYRPRVAGFDGDRTVLSSPTGEEPFDAIDTVAVGLAYEETAAGFNATVTVPLALLGLAPEPGATPRMDLGYIFGNQQGSRALARAYAFNNSFSANIVDDIPNESRLEPAEWGTALIK